MAEAVRNRMPTWAIMALYLFAVIQEITLPSARADHRDGEGVEIVATAWGPSLDIRGTGFYNDLARLVLERSKEPVKYYVLPYARAKARFIDQTEDCIFPNNIDVLLKGKEIANAEGLIQSEPILNVTVHFFSRPDTAPPSSIDDLEGLRIGYALGSAMPAFFEGLDAEFVAVSGEVSKYQMLEAGRVDVIAGSLPDNLFAFPKDPARRPIYDPNFVMAAEQVGFVCHNTPQTVDALGRINEAVRDLRQSGALTEFLRAHDLAPAAHLP